jgi:hypothetical protein
MLSTALARCRLPKVWQWNTLTVFFQADQGGQSQLTKAYIGHMYFGSCASAHLRSPSTTQFRPRSIRYALRLAICPDGMSQNKFDLSLS